MRLNEPLGIVSSAADASVLGVLARVKSDLTITQVQALIPRLSAEGIRKALKRLVAEGIVELDIVGRTHLYRLNRDHLGAGAIAEIANLYSTLCSRLTSEMRGWPDPPTFSCIFGSAARGDMRSDSDIDVFALRPSGVDEDNWSEFPSALSLKASRWTGNDVRFLVWGEEEIATTPESHSLLHTILKEGIVLISSSRTLANLLSP